MSKVAFLIDNTIINDKSCFSFLKSAVEDAGLDDVSYINIFKNPNMAKEDMPSVYPQIINYIKKSKITKVVIFGNNGIFTCGFNDKPEKISKFRGKILTKDELPGVDFFALESPFAVDRDRTREVTFRSDLALIRRVLDGKFESQAKMKIYDIESPEDIDELIKVAKETGVCAYDYETSGLDRINDIVGTASFCPKIDEEGVAHVWFYAEYDQLVPRFKPEALEQLKKKFTEFFDLNQEENFYRIAWNQNFDDWMTETWLGKKIELSVWDAMYMKWTVNTQRPHNLKYSTAVYLGYPEYDEFFEKKVAEVKARRNRNLVEEEDFKVLEFFGVSPIKTVRTFKTKPDKITYKWPKNFSKAKAAYLTVDLDIVREYNSLDSVYTLMLFEKLKTIIVENNLEESCELRHRGGQMFLRGEQHGILLDVELNRKWAAELETYIEKTANEVRTLVAPYLPDHRKPEEFNPGSADHINEVFYGELGYVPYPNVDSMLKYFKDEDILKLVNQVEEELYEDYSGIKDLLRQNDFSFNLAKQAFEEELYKKIFEEDHDIDFPYYVNENYKIPFTKKALGLGGLELDPVGTTKTGKPSTSKSSLLTLSTQKKSDIIDLILMYRKCVKYKSAFVDKIYEARDEHNIVRTAHNVTGTVTGRTSSSKSGELGFNIQQIPSIFKRQFIARPGYGILSGDLSQAEVYTLAAFADDKVLQEALRQKDLHKYVASQIFKIEVADVTKDKRAQGKTTLFLTVYGGGAKKLASAFPGMKVSEAQLILDDFKTAFADATVWLENQKELARQEPHYVYTAFGTRISVSGVMSEDFSTVLRAERIAGNAPIQGTAGEVMIYKQANIEDRKHAENLDINWLMSVHDQAGWEVPLDGVKVEWIDDGKGGKAQSLSGKYYDIIQDEFNKFVPFSPIENVKYKLDMEFYTRWGGDEVDLALGLSSEKPGDIFRWDLILDEDEETDIGDNKEDEVE